MKPFINVLCFAALGGVLGSAHIFWNTHWQFWAITGIAAVLQLVNEI